MDVISAKAVSLTIPFPYLFFSRHEWGSCQNLLCHLYLCLTFPLFPFIFFKHHFVSILLCINKVMIPHSDFLIMSSYRRSSHVKFSQVSQSAFLVPFSASCFWYFMCRRFDDS
jgi:hypothetical protein